MTQCDIWLDEPIDLGSYPNVIHIINTPNEQYIEDVDNEILFFDEMDEETYKATDDYVKTWINF